MLRRRDLLLAAAPAFAAGPLRLVDVPGDRLEVLAGGTLLAAYRYSAARPKTYVHPLCLPDGRPVTLDGPEDHVHHRGLMVAWSEVNGFDFWGEVNPAPHGQIVHQRFERRQATRAAEVVAVNHWIADGKLLLVERRRLRVPPPDRDGTWLEWRSEFEAVVAVQLAAGKHVYNGLGLRVTPEMNGGQVLNSRGTSTIEAANGEPARWCAYWGGGAGVAMFDHPANPRHPNAFFVMNQPFGYLSAAPTFREPFSLAPRERLRFRWGVLAFAGAAVAEMLDKRFESWSKEKS